MGTSALDAPAKHCQINCQGALKGINLRGKTKVKRRFLLIFPGKQSIWEAQILIENRRVPQKIADWHLSLRFVPLTAAISWFLENRGSFKTVP